MKTEKIQRVVLASLLVFLWAGPALAWSWRGRGPEEDRQHKRGDKHEWMVKQLGLTEEQQEQMREHRREQMERQRALWEETRAKREELADELQKTKINEARIRELADQLKDLAGQGIDSRIEGILTMKSILTPEQFEQFHEKVKEFREKGKRHGPRSRKGERRGCKNCGPDSDQPPDAYAPPPPEDEGW